MPAEIQPGSLIADRYRLVVRLDAGGRAQTWQAEDEQLERPVAIKLLVTPADAGPDFVERFRAEAQAEAKLTHPGIVEVYDWGQAGDVNYVVMAFLEGRTLRQALQHDGPLSADQVRTMAQQVAAALVYARGAGVTHGALSADKVVLAPDGKATVIGFGVGQRTGSAPAPAAVPDPDAYALGGLMYEALTRFSPFAGPPATQPAGKPWPQPVTALVPDVPGELARIVTKAIDPDPAKRYASIQAMKADLDSLAAPKKGKAGIWIAVAAVAVLLLLLAIPFLRGGQTSAVPDVVGRSSAEASAALAQAGFKMVVVETTVSATAAQDSVVSQDPAGGTQEKAGTQVRVVVSSGKATVAVPAVGGLGITAASAKIVDAGLVVGKVSTIATTTFPAGTVVLQDPIPGTQVALGTKVDLVQSSGVERGTVPDVRGMQQADAESALEAAGFKVTVGSVYGPEPAGQVTAQAPAAGTTLQTGATVSITVSKGTAPVSIPNVMGATQAAATASIQNAGLVPVSVEASSSDYTKIGLVIAQDPAASEKVAPGSQVRITIGK